MSQLIGAPPDQLSQEELDERLTRLEREMLEAVIIAFDAFSAGAKLWAHCMQIGAEINMREAAAFGKQQRTKAKGIRTNKHRGKAPNGVKSRIALRPVRRAAVV